jgi:hypothetical protein
MASAAPRPPHGHKSGTQEYRVLPCDLRCVCQKSHDLACDFRLVGQESRDLRCDFRLVGQESRDLPCDLRFVSQKSRDLLGGIFSPLPCPCIPGPGAATKHSGMEIIFQNSKTNFPRGAVVPWGGQGAAPAPFRD